MRARSGNPYNEAHGKNLRAYEFIADGAKSPADVCAALETSLGLRLQGDSTGQHGFVNTSKRADGSMFVAVVLYEACAGCEHHTTPHARATDPLPAKLIAAKVAAGEHPTKKLTGTPADEAVLRSLGFTDNDPALRA